MSLRDLFSSRSCGVGLLVRNSLRWRVEFGEDIKGLFKLWCQLNLIVLCCIVESTGLCKHNIYLSCAKCPPLLSTWIDDHNDKSSHVTKLNTSVSTQTFVFCHNINFLSNITLLHPPKKQLYHIVYIFTLSEICCTSTFRACVNGSAIVI
jgi:hypothetical protein